ncbi:polysaccharide biosynthesis C-terminal domain-containing protein [Gottfriedia acidiceleris]|uniref:polysaccharide biosynthesis C-terminal domain-containing protein n=1 Tax=Gottfriedia acidiceleris TaxID=371036 RepID=UPI003000BD90
MEFITRTIIANSQGPAINGKIQIFESYINIFLLAAIFGLNTSMLKFINLNSTKMKLKNVFTTILGINFIISIFISFFIYILVKFFIFKGQIELINAFSCFIFVLPFFSITSFSQGTYVHFLIGRGEIKISSKYKLIASSILYVFLTLVTLIFGFKGYYFTYFIYIIISIFPCIFLFKNYIDLSLFVNVIFSFKTWINNKYIKFAFPAFIANCLSLLITNVDVILLSVNNISVNKIGVYSVAILISRGVLIIPMGYLQSNFSKINYKISEDRSLYITLYKKEIRNLIIIMLPITIILILISNIMTNILFNDTYSNSVDITRLLMISTFFQSLGMVAGNIFLILEKVKVNLYLNIIRLVLTLLFSYLFLMKFSISGLAFSGILTNMIFVVIQGLIIRRVKI